MMQIKIFKTLPSTSLKAKELAKRGSKPWTVIVAEKQIQGYGKDKRIWFSPKGGLYFSIVLPKLNVKYLQTITILAAFVVAKNIKETFKIEPFIKLPNDVLLDGKKVAGILTENLIGREVKFSVMGIGLNTNIDRFPEDLKSKATSLKIELGREVDNKAILLKIINGLKEQLKFIIN